MTAALRKLKTESIALRVLINSERERERERERDFSPKFNQPWSKSKLWLGIILGVLVLVGTGTTIYLVTRSKTETETLTTEERVQQFQNQLSQLQNHLNTLNQNITQTEASLQTKRTEKAQNPQNHSLNTEINQLGEQLNTYKAQKAKLETIIPKLEQKISNLGKTGSNPEPNSEQTKIIQQLEQEIKEINKELGIKDEPKQKKPDKPIPDRKPNKPDKPDSPVPDLPNSTLQNFLSDLELIKIHLENCNKINEANKENLTRNADGTSKYQTDQKKYADGLAEIKQLQTKFNDNSNASEITRALNEFRQKWSNVFNPHQKSPTSQVDPQIWQTLQNQYSEINALVGKINQDFSEFFNQWESQTQEIRDFAENMFKDYLSVKAMMKNFQDPINECLGAEFLTDSQHQIFLSASPETQKTNIELIEASFSSSLLEIKYRLEIVYEYMTGTLKFTEDFVEEMKKNMPGTDTSEADIVINNLKTAFATRDNLVANFDQKAVAEKIKAVSGLYQELERIDWKNQKNN